MARELQYAFERKLVHHCAPTLAGTKPSSLFRCGVLQGKAFPYSAEQQREAINIAHEKLRSAGVSVSGLQGRSDNVLVLVYRPAHIEGLLRREKHCRLLARAGIDTSSCKSCVASLQRRMESFCCQGAPEGCATCDFPHEIGVLLGYPLEDVEGFIENRGKNHLFCGMWKVYSDVERAQSLFACFKQNTKEFDGLFAQCRCLERLVNHMAPSTNS